TLTCKISHPTSGSSNRNRPNGGWPPKKEAREMRAKDGDVSLATVEDCNGSMRAAHPGDHRGTRLDAKLFEDVNEVSFYRCGPDAEALADLTVGPAAADQFDDIDLSCRQSVTLGLIGARRAGADQVEFEIVVNLLRDVQCPVGNLAARSPA